jgi:hypothetical protein
MDELLQGLLGPERYERTSQQANLQGLMNLGQSLIRAGQGGQGGRVSTLAGLGMAAPAYMQGRQQAFDQTLQDILRQTQVQDLLRQRQEQEMAKRRQAQVQQMIPSLYRERMGQVPTTIPTETYEDVQTTVPGVVGVQLDPERLRMLGMLGPEGMQAATQLSQFQKALQPGFKIEKRKTVSGAEELVKIYDDGTVETIGKGVSDIKPISFDDQTQAYIKFRFAKPFEQLNASEMREVIAFQNAPNAKDAAAAVAESQRVRFETGQGIPVPKSRDDFLREAQAGVKPSVPASPTEPPKLPTVPPSVSTKPIGPKEAPLIESSAVSPKQKQELTLAKPKQMSAVESVVNTSRRMQQTINEILKNPGFNDAFGLSGTVISSIPGTDAARVKSQLEQLSGNLFIDAITAMRNASATGAAVGSVTEKEGDKLQSSQAALKQAQKPADVRKELQKLLEMLKFQEQGVVNAFNRTYGAGEFNLMQPSPPEPPAGRKPLGDIFGGQ